MKGGAPMPALRILSRMPGAGTSAVTTKSRESCSFNAGDEVLSNYRVARRVELEPAHSIAGIADSLQKRRTEGAEGVGNASAGSHGRQCLIGTRLNEAAEPDRGNRKGS